MYYINILKQDLSTAETCEHNLLETRLIANSSSCTTTELSLLLTSSLTAINVIKYCEKVYERNVKN